MKRITDAQIEDLANKIELAATLGSDYAVYCHQRRHLGYNDIQFFVHKYPPQGKHGQLVLIVDGYANTILNLTRAALLCVARKRLEEL